MDELEQKKTGVGQDTDLPTLDMSKLGNMVKAPEVSPQPVEEAVGPAPLVPKSKLLHPQKKKCRLVALAMVAVLGVIGGGHGL